MACVLVSSIRKRSVDGTARDLDSTDKLLRLKVVVAAPSLKIGSGTSDDDLVRLASGKGKREGALRRRSCLCEGASSAIVRVPLSDELDTSTNKIHPITT